MSDDIHSCSYYCDQPECVRAQRDELRERLERAEMLRSNHAWQEDEQCKRAEKAEAERDAVAVANCPRMCGEFCNEYQTQRALEQAEARLARAVELLRAADPHIYGNDSEQWLTRVDALLSERAGER